VLLRQLGCRASNAALCPKLRISFAIEVTESHFIGFLSLFKLELEFEKVGFQASVQAQAARTEDAKGAELLARARERLPQGSPDPVKTQLFREVLA
jgi:hypothetical protein